MSSDRNSLDRRILAFIGSAGASEPFDALAGDLFVFQFEHNRVYRACCEPPPAADAPTAFDWRNVPAPWPAAWRMADLCCFDPADAVAMFLSSGTTHAAGSSSGRSRHLFDTLELYQAALAGPFAQAMLAKPPDRQPMLVLMPSPDEQPDSSLSFMMGEALDRFGQPDACGFFIRDGQLRLDDFVEAVTQVAAIGQPTVLASTALGWVMLLDRLAGRKIPLPAGSRVMETGGYKGRVREWSRASLYTGLFRTFALPPGAVVSEYGMCELSSQFYATGGDRPVFTGPPWTRVLAIDPETQRPVPPDEPGLLRVIDLANRGSCMAVQTEDLVVVRGEQAFELIGRAPAAPTKGCSLTAEDLAMSEPPTA